MDWSYPRKQVSSQLVVEFIMSLVCFTWVVAYEFDVFYFFSVEKK